MAKKISFSSGMAQLRYGTKEALKIARDAGFDGVDFSLDSFGWGPQPNIVNMPHDEFVEHFKDIKAYADSIGLELATAHGLVYAYGADESRNEQLRLKCLRDLEACSIMGIKYCVIHSVGTGSYGYDTPLEFMHEKNQEMYNDFIPTAEKFGVFITPESFGGIKIDGVMGYDHFADHVAMRNEYDALNTKNKAFCLDSGHTNVAAGGGYLPVDEFARYFGDRIKMLHLHDNNGFTDQHLFPGQGTINWPNLFDALDEIGYDGYYNFEMVVRYGKNTDEAIKFLGKYLRDFVDKRGKV